jgi:hypothetical protein
VTVAGVVFERDMVGRVLNDLCEGVRAVTGHSHGSWIRAAVCSTYFRAYLDVTVARVRSIARGPGRRAVAAETTKMEDVSLSSRGK